MPALALLLGVLAAATAAGLLLRSRSGRVRATGPVGSGEGPGPGTGAGPDPGVLDALGVRPGEAAVTLVQFSSAFCAPCRATRTLLADVTGRVDGARHVEVDAESHLDAVRALDIRRTPTTLVLDRAGRVVARIGGVPRRPELTALLAAMTGG